MEEAWDHREVQEWGDHFKRYPPGDFLNQKISAEIWSLIATYLTRKPRSPYEVAPWLRPPEDPADATRARRAQAAARMLGALERMREARGE